MRQITYSVGFGRQAVPGQPVIDLETVDIESLPAHGEIPAVTLLARAPADLRRALAVDDRMPSARRVELILDGVPSWRPPPLPAPGDESLWQHLVAFSAAVDEARRWVVTATFAEHVPSGEVLGSISRMLDGHGGIGPLAGPTGPGTVTTPAPHLPQVPKPDVHLSRRDLREISALRDLGLGDLGSAGADNGAAFTLGDIPPVDERSVNPIGFSRYPDDGVGEIRAGGDGYHVCVAGRRVLSLPRSGAITDVDIERLRPLRGVGGAFSAAPEKGLARLLIAMAAAGVPLAGAPTRDWTRVLGEAPAALIGSVTEEDLADPLSREQHSIRLRRWALTDHGITARWQRLMAARGVSVLPEPLVSVLLCTRRPAMISSGLRQVARQRGVRLEVILTLHGLSRDDPAVARAISGFGGPLSVVEVDASVSFGEALNRGAARASGSFIARMDDDDWYGARYLSDALLAQRYSGADLVGCFGSFVYLESLDVTMYHESPRDTPNWMARGKVPPGTYLIIPGATMFVTRAAFEAVGGFKPVHIFEDTEFTSSVAATGGRIHRTHGLNFMFRRREPKEHLWQEPVSEFVTDDSVCRPGRYFNDLMEIADGEEPLGALCKTGRECRPSGPARATGAP